MKEIKDVIYDILVENKERILQCLTDELITEIVLTCSQELKNHLTIDEVTQNVLKKIRGEDV